MSTEAEATLETVRKLRSTASQLGSFAGDRMPIKAWKEIRQQLVEQFETLESQIAGMGDCLDGLKQFRKTMNEGDTMASQPK